MDECQCSIMNTDELHYQLAGPHVLRVNSHTVCVWKFVMEVTTEMNCHQSVLNVDARLCTTADSDIDGWCSHCCYVCCCYVYTYGRLMLVVPFCVITWGRVDRILAFL